MWISVSDVFSASENPFRSILKALEKPDGGEFGNYYSLPALNDPRIGEFPFISDRYYNILLEDVVMISLVRVL